MTIKEFHDDLNKLNERTNGMGTGMTLSAEKLRHELKSLDIRPGELAALAGAELRSTLAILAGVVKTTNINIITKYARALGVAVETITVRE